MAVSQKQIAERVGVSIALVSRVLSGKARDVGIAAATIERVLHAAAEMGYVPSAAALTLKGKSSRTIGVVVYDFLDPFFGSIIEQLQAQAHDLNYSLVLVGFKGRHPDEADLSPLHKHAIDGLIIIGSASPSEWLSSFRSMPVARIGHGDQDEISVRINMDECDAAQQLVDHFASKGIKRCAFIGSNLFGHSLRHQALEQAAKRSGIVVEKNLWASLGFDAGREAVKSMLAGPNCPEAIICATDVIAMGALHALHNAGRVIPVSGFDDIPGAKQFLPSITTVRQPVEEMARKAFRSVVESAAPEQVPVKGQLVIRSSS